MPRFCRIFSSVNATAAPSDLERGARRPMTGRRKIAAYAWQVRLERHLYRLARVVDVYNAQLFRAEMFFKFGFFIRTKCG